LFWILDAARINAYALYADMNPRPAIARVAFPYASSTPSPPAPTPPASRRRASGSAPLQRLLVITTFPNKPLCDATASPAGSFMVCDRGRGPIAPRVASISASPTVFCC